MISDFLRDHQDLIFEEDYGYGDTLQLMSQLEEASPATGLVAYTSSILSRHGGTDFWLLSSYKNYVLLRYMMCPTFLL